jgi:hypothetical protein
MGYSLEAFIAREHLLHGVVTSYEYTEIISVQQGFCLLLNTDEFHDEVMDKNPRDHKTPYPEFWKLSLELSTFGVIASVQGPVAYIEADFFGGPGTQASIVWDRGRVRLKPNKRYFRHDKVKLDRMPINQALRMLGVKRGNHIDEFEALGLDRYRHTNQWIEEHND